MGARGVTSRRALIGGLAASAFVGATPIARAAAPKLRAQLFPIDQGAGGPFPEQSTPRYSAALGQCGVAFSGGGPRAFAAALGQMRGLVAAGMLQRIGAISCVSGGTWFGSLFTFAAASFSDAALLGAYVPPGALTVELLETLDTALGEALHGLSDEAIVAAFAANELLVEFGLLPADKLWSRILNDLLLTPVGLGGVETLFTLDAVSKAAILRRNPLLLLTPIQVCRADRPFLIAGSTQIYPEGVGDAASKGLVGLPGQIYRSVEYTPLYAGAPQFYPGAGPGGLDFGGGYVESFAFATPAPSAAAVGGIVAVPQAKFPFLLSDAVGSSSAALSSIIDVLRYSGGFPEFRYWPVQPSARIGKEPATLYSFGDGGILENTGVVALLRRGYRSVFAFVNSPFPIGASSAGCVAGIDGQISRLFGLIPADNYGSSQDTQLFAEGDFVQLAAGLAAAKRAGRPPVYVATHQVLAGNPFGIPPGPAQLFWIYNDRNAAWVDALPSPVRALLSGTDPNNYLDNFPNYATVLQNADELLLLTRRQINLLAHMWAYTVREGFRTQGEAFGVPITAYAL